MKQQVTPSAATTPTSPDPIHPIQRGEIVNWDVLESILHYALYDQLPSWVQGAEGSLLMIEPALTSRSDRELLTQLMFEVFNVSNYYATDSAVASLAGVGKLSGVVVDIGYDKIDVMPVLDGLLQASSGARLPYGGQNLTTYIQQLLAEKGINVSLEDAEKIKLSAMHVAPLPGSEPQALAPGGGLVAADAAGKDDAERKAEEEKQKERRKTYTLPDGQIINVGKEGKALGEAVLNPSLLGFTLPTLSEAIQTAGLVTTLHGGKESAKILAENLLVCGGGAGAHGISQRLLAEVTATAHPNYPPALCNIPEYMPKRTAQRAAWIGGAVMAKIVFSGSGPMQISQHPVSKADYDEMGPAIIHRKCS
jgi:actin-related protein 7, plant